MASLYVNTQKHTSKFLEGWMEHKSMDGKWSKYWCVLSGNNVHIFSNPRPSKETHVGTIEVGQGSRLMKREGDEKNGYKFDLYTLKKVNRFRTSKFSERELWKAFIEGISTGIVPENIDLLPGQIADVQLSLNDYFKQQQLVKRPLPIPTEPPPESCDSGFDTPNTSTSGNFSSLDGDDNYLIPVSPKVVPPVDKLQQRLIFYPDSRRNDVPSWFFPNCTRELAVEILERGAKYGNTLMRESTTDSKNLVISKRMESSGGKTETHYVVNRLPLGYKIDVENPHEPMKSLSEVMEFFIETSGIAVTFPMTCNDLSKLGITEKIYNHYNTKIVKVLYDADSGEETVDSPVRKVSSTVESAPLPHKSLRSKSVPNIGHIAGLKKSITEDCSFSNSYENTGKTFSHQVRRTSGQDVSSSVTSNQSDFLPPPLPPNHPPPLKPAASLDSSKELKSHLPRHTQSLGTGDNPIRKQNSKRQQIVNANIASVNTQSSETFNDKTTKRTSPSSEEPNKASEPTFPRSTQLSQSNAIVYAIIKKDSENEHCKDFTLTEPAKNLVNTSEEAYASNINLMQKGKISLVNSDESLYEPVDESSPNITYRSIRHRNRFAFYKRRFSLYEPLPYSTCHEVEIGSPQTKPPDGHFYLGSIEEVPSDNLDSYEKLENCYTFTCGKWKDKVRSDSLCMTHLEENKKLQDDSDEDYEIIPGDILKRKNSADFSLSSSEELYDVLDDELQVHYSSVLNISNCSGSSDFSLSKSSSSRPLSLYSLNGTYSEVADFASLTSFNQSEDYVDIIANDEDIKAARSARGSFSGPSTKKVSICVGMRRSNSDLGRVHPQEEMFKKTLEGLLGSSTTRASGLLSQSQSVSQLNVANSGSGTYSSYNEHYQNIGCVQRQSNLRK